MNVPRWARALHGTGARARRHQRDGETPVRRYCPACANADVRERNLRAGSKTAGAVREAA